MPFSPAVPLPAMTSNEPSLLTRHLSRFSGVTSFHPSPYAISRNWSSVPGTIAYISPVNLKAGLWSSLYSPRAPVSLLYSLMCEKIEGLTERWLQMPAKELRRAITGTCFPKCQRYCNHLRREKTCRISLSEHPTFPEIQVVQNVVGGSQFTSQLILRLPACRYRPIPVRVGNHNQAPDIYLRQGSRSLIGSASRATQAEISSTSVSSSILGTFILLIKIRYRSIAFATCKRRAHIYTLYKEALATN